MNKFNRLTLLGSSILIGLVTISALMIYFGIRQSLTDDGLLKPERSLNSVDTIRIERIIEKPVHDTVRVEVMCSRKHCDHSQVSTKVPALNRLDSSQKDTQLHGN
jgi:hypothetical protein